MKETKMYCDTCTEEIGQYKKEYGGKVELHVNLGGNARTTYNKTDICMDCATKVYHLLTGIFVKNPTHDRPH